MARRNGSSVLGRKEDSHWRASKNVQSIFQAQVHNCRLKLPFSLEHHQEDQNLWCFHPKKRQLTQRSARLTQIFQCLCRYFNVPHCLGGGWAPCSLSCRDREQSLPVNPKWREYFKMSAWQSLVNWPFISQQWHFATYPEACRRLFWMCLCWVMKNPGSSELIMDFPNWQANPLPVASHCGYKYTVTTP